MYVPEIYVEKPATIDFSKMQLPVIDFDPALTLTVVGVSLAVGFVTSIVVCNRSLKQKEENYRKLVDEMFEDSVRFLNFYSQTNRTVEKTLEYIENGFKFVEKEIRKIRAYDPLSWRMRTSLEKHVNLMKSYAIMKVQSYSTQNLMSNFYKSR